MMKIKKLLLLGAAASTMLISCKNQFRINATSGVAALEGKTLYLRIFKDGQMMDIDSAQVIHGRFDFDGSIDSTTIACVFMDEMCLLPVVLEQGNVQLKLNEALQTPGGTPLNDTLAAFIRQKAYLEQQMSDLSRKESQMVMEGVPYDSIVQVLSHEAETINSMSDRLITQFISRNYDNVLGAGVFMILTGNFPYPILNPQIETVLGMGTPYFLENPYVKEYVKIARENMEKLHEEKQQ